MSVVASERTKDVRMSTKITTAVLANCHCAIWRSSVQRFKFKVPGASKQQRGFKYLARHLQDTAPAPPAKKSSGVTQTFTNVKRRLRRLQNLKLPDILWSRNWLRKSGYLNSTVYVWIWMISFKTAHTKNSDDATIRMKGEQWWTLISGWSPYPA